MSDENTTTAVWIPLTPKDVPELEALLRNEAPFVASTIDTDDHYRLVNYIKHSIHGGAQIAAILDRNLVSRVVALAVGRRVDHSSPGSATDRVAAACMAFLIAAEVLTEPNISLYELTESEDTSDGQTDLIAFRIADHIHPQAYLEVALGRAHGIAPELIEQARRIIEGRDPRAVDLAMPLRHWRRHRCVLAEIALLERTSLSGREKFERLIQWSVSPGFFDGVAIAFAARLFGRAKPSGRLLKHARSANAAKCLAGIRNAAWDLTYISHWAKQSVADEGRRIWILCTNDKVLQDLAKVAVGDESQISELFQKNWQPAEAVELEQQYFDAWSRAQSSLERSNSMRKRFEQIDELTASIEAKIRESCDG